ncbi:MAG: hypothetical protein EOO99_07735 [Pedobacter sp.]|nr:MAG: hypothetical protein EOO99_07735 [Pedobacter sp.]
MEHKHKDKKELFEHIQDSLQHYEEAYMPGAWENFKKFEQAKAKKVVTLWRWASVAAAFVVSLSVLLMLGKNPAKEVVLKGDSELAAGSNLSKPSDLTSPEVSNINPNLNPQADLNGVYPATERIASNRHIQTLQYEASEPNLTQQVVATELSHVLPRNTEVIDNLPANASMAIVNGVTEAIADQALANVNSDQVESDVKSAIVRDDVKDIQAPKSKLKIFNNNRWALGLMVAPSVGQNTSELNLGYGVSVNYNISPKLSLSSGIAYSKLNASKNLPINLGTSSVVLGNNKKLAIISEEVSGIDIPFELKYQFSPKVYANFGFSGFAVVNQKRSNTFVQDVVVIRPGNSSASVGGNTNLGSGPGNTTLSDPSGPQGQFANSYIVRQMTTENVSNQALDNINFLGFYNFSVGYSRRIYKQNTLAIEPFFKLPVREVTQDNLRMVNTGVRIKVGF